MPAETTEHCAMGAPPPNKLKRIARMKQIQIFLLSAALIFVVTALGQETKSAADASAATVSTSGRARYRVPGLPGLSQKRCRENESLSLNHANVYEKQIFSPSCCSGGQ